MKLFNALAIVASATLICASPSFAEGKRITTQAEFNKVIVGKRLLFGDDWVKITKNGKLRGNFGGKVTVGVWEWRDTFWCRTLTKPRQNTDCQTWAITADGVKVTRDRGKGRSFIYTFK